MNLKNPIICGLTAAALCLSVPTLAQKLYKWVDEEGNIHYSDKVPPEHVKQAREEFNEQGIVVDRVERAKTPEEIAAEEAAQARAAEEAQRRENQRQEDRRLLAIYSNEEDIERARQQQKEAIQRSVEASRAFVNGQSKSLAKLMERAAEAQDRGEAVSEALQSSIDRAQSEIRQQEEFIAEKESEMAALDEHYDAQLQRFREIKRRYATDQTSG